MENAIVVKNLRKNYKDFQLKDISFSVPKGCIMGFVGENGAGKTTLLDAISLPLLEYKSDGFSLDDMNDPQQQTTINVLSNSAFSVKGTMVRIWIIRNLTTSSSSVKKARKRTGRGRVILMRLA